MAKDNHDDEEELDPLDQEDENASEEEEVKKVGDDEEEEDMGETEKEQMAEAGEDDEIVESSDERTALAEDPETAVSEDEQDEPHAHTHEHFHSHDDDEEAEEEVAPVSTAVPHRDFSMHNLHDQPGSKEHTLDDLANEEDSQVPTGVDPRGPKSFAMDMNEDFKPNRQPFASGMSGSGLYSNKKSGSKKGLNTLLLFIIAVLVIGGSVYLLKGKLFGSKESSLTYNTPVASTTPAPTETPAPTLDRSQFKITILNGSGKTGLAASVSAKLQNLGYTITKTGNATNSAFLKTVVLTKDGDSSLSAQLVQDLAPDFDASANGVLPASNASDGEVILGQH